ncbi:MAG: ABC transporter ATP-binding protein [Syntrophorhabdaceae bacterium]
MTPIQKLQRILTGKEKLGFVIIIGLSVLLSISEIFSIGILVPIINLFLNPETITASPKLRTLYAWSGAGDPLSFLTLLVFAAILLFVGKSVCGVAVVYWQQRYVAAINLRLTSDILKEYLYRPYEFHLLNNSSTLFKNVNAEVGQFVSYYLNPVTSILSEGIVLCGVFFVAVYLYPGVTLITTAIIAVSATGLNSLFKRRMARYAEERNTYSEQYYQAIMEALQSVKEIKVFNVHEYFVGKFVRSFGKYFNSVVKSTIVGQLPRYYLEALLFSVLLGMILISVHSSMNYREIIPMIAIMGVVAIRLMPSISKIVSSLNSMHYALNSLDMVYAIVAEVRENLHKAAAAVPIEGTRPASALRLDNVSFGYAAGKQDVMRGFSLTVAPQAITAFAGETGTGKSTLIDIIMGLLLPQKGSMWYGDIRIDGENIDGYRARIGYVPQTITLVDDTIAANIAFGVPPFEVEAGRLQRAVEFSQLSKFIDELPEGLQTVVGERGVRLSGGQRQRIGIARALYRDPEILILDEATSALDAHTEEQVYGAIKRLHRTVIMVTHRQSALAFADMIYVLHEGGIREQGIHSELCEKSPYLKNLSNADGE